MAARSSATILAAAYIVGLANITQFNHAQGSLMDTRNRRLMWYGILLFLLGLLTVLLESHFSNMHMGPRRTAHWTAPSWWCQAIWAEVKLPVAAKTPAIRAQVLCYPVTDASMNDSSYQAMLPRCRP
jgi:hypothetical protein